MKLNFAAMGYQFLSVCLGLSVIVFLWSIKPIFCGLICGLYASRSIYLSVYQYIQVRKIVKKQQETLSAVQSGMHFHNIPVKPVPCNTDNITQVDFSKGTQNDPA